MNARSVHRVFASLYRPAAAIFGEELWCVDVVCVLPLVFVSWHVLEDATILVPPVEYAFVDDVLEFVMIVFISDGLWCWARERLLDEALPVGREA